MGAWRFKRAGGPSLPPYQLDSATSLCSLSDFRNQGRMDPFALKLNAPMVQPRETITRILQIIDRKVYYTDSCTLARSVNLENEKRSAEQFNFFEKTATFIWKPWFAWFGVCQFFLPSRGRFILLFVNFQSSYSTEMDSECMLQLIGIIFTRKKEKCEKMFDLLLKVQTRRFCGGGERLSRSLRFSETTSLNLAKQEVRLFPYFANGRGDLLSKGR